MLPKEAQNGDNDFRAQLTKIAAAQPDVLFIPWNYENVCLIAQQARELGIEGVFFGADGWDATELTRAVPAVHWRAAIMYPVQASTFRRQLLTVRYGIREEYNVALEAECLYGNDGVMWIKQAIEAAGSDDPTAIRDQLEATTSFDGLLGHMSIDPATHNPRQRCRDL
ncbi:MAG: ABC transporter substrate-binding protein [Lachnospiraceae bacterium]